MCRNTVPPKLIFGLSAIRLTYNVKLITKNVNPHGSLQNEHSEKLPKGMARCTQEVRLGETT